jgi:hypothetical protein
MRNLSVFFILLIIGGCKEAFEPQIPADKNNLLVVEGFINTGLKATVIKLSRTASMGKAFKINAELKAKVSIEGETNSTYMLLEKPNGIYSSLPLNLPINERYRLRIKTANGKEYLSDFTEVKNSPPIDSVSWRKENGGVQIYVNTHDPKNNTHYYQWDYKETWEIYSPFLSNLEYKADHLPQSYVGVLPRRKFKYGAIERAKYYDSACWKSDSLKQILLGTSIKLSEDIIHLKPITYIPPAAEKICFKYSILVKQTSLTKEAFEYLQNMKKSSEQLGSIFDPQPSDISGNIHCVTHPDELVVGYISAGDVTEKRIFINTSEVHPWGYDMGCIEIEEDSIDVSSLGKSIYPSNYRDNGYTLFMVAANRECIDCTFRGSNIKPTFWP